MLSLVLPVLLLVVGAALLTAGAEGFAENVSGAASRLGVSVLALGVLLAGAEPEEAVTAMLASGQGLLAAAGGRAGDVERLRRGLTVAQSGAVQLEQGTRTLRRQAGRLAGGLDPVPPHR